MRLGELFSFASEITDFLFVPQSPLALPCLPQHHPEEGDDSKRRHWDWEQEDLAQGPRRLLL